MEKSDPLIVPRKPANKVALAAAEPAEGSGGTTENAGLQSTVRTQSRAAVSQAQTRIREAVNRNKKEKLTALLHHVGIDGLRAAFLGLKRRAAAGVDQLTWEHYAMDLEANLEALHGRVHTGAYRALPSRRQYIPKADGKQRPLGIAALEDKIVQAAVVAILTPIYEAEFLGFSYGFRPGRGQHDALDALAYGVKGRNVWWILDADIRSFFDTISHEWLIRFIEHRVGDPRIIRLIRKWLQAGVLEDGQKIETKEGTPQGAVISPLLANIYLHYVYDLWAHAWRKRQANGDMIIVRYADDTVVGFQYRATAARFLADLKDRLAKFSLSLHPGKTRLIEFGRFAAERRRRRGAGKPETFDFLGFTHICGTKRNGQGFQLLRRSKRKGKWAKVREIAEELRRIRHMPIEGQGRWLGGVLRGYYAYFAVPTNLGQVRALRHHVKVRWFLSLRRRSQKDRLSWRRMNALADRFLPLPIVLHPWPDYRFLVNHPR
ncbi:MAG: group II intron reverse transcriptase/maturase [Hyphomicrobiales bacterium]|nr:group II intron reverse transcriptase/maturase [Hyphomicrobiales bacterium]